MAPKDENELQHMLYTALQLEQPVAIRYPRGSGLGVPIDQEFSSLPVGVAEVLRHGSHATLVAIGNTVAPAREAAERLAAEGITCTVVNSRFIKPLDVQTLRDCVATTQLLVTIEEHVLSGGFGSAVLETLAAQGLQPPVIRLGIPDVFVEHGSQKQLRAQYHIDADGIVATVHNFLRTQGSFRGTELLRAAR